jgi:uncharacterized protein
LTLLPSPLFARLIPGLQALRGAVLAFAAAILVLWPLAPALALAAGAFPEVAPAGAVVDQADLLSRAASAEVSRELEAFSAEGIDARLVTVNQLDYGLSLPQLGRDLLQRWDGADSPQPQLLVLIDGQTNATAVVASPDLEERLGADLLRSTARTTMAQPIREGSRYRQASLAGLGRLLVVVRGGEDPGEPGSLCCWSSAPSCRWPPGGCSRADRPWA